MGAVGGSRRGDVRGAVLGKFVFEHPFFALDSPHVEFIADEAGEQHQEYDDDGAQHRAEEYKRERRRHLPCEEGDGDYRDILEREDNGDGSENKAQDKEK